MFVNNHDLLVFVVYFPDYVYIPRMNDENEFDYSKHPVKVGIAVKG